MKSRIHQIAVLGAGTMGSQIAAHFANAGFEVLLFDLIDDKGTSSNIELSVQKLQKLDPAPLANPSFVKFIHACNYQKDLEKLKACDLIIEAVAEDLEIKSKLYQQIAPNVATTAILASNTSGLSITKLAQTLPENLRPRFMGLHFFNPPRYLLLLELIPHAHTDIKLINELEEFLTSFIGKQVVKAHDTPNFIANRLGVFGLLMTLHHAERLKIPFEVVDELTGKLIGRPKSATLRTLDLVGLDVFSHVVKTMREELQEDPWHHYFSVSPWIQELINNKSLGQKSGKGIYQKTQDGLFVFDPLQKSYRPIKHKADVTLVKDLDKNGLKIWPSLQENNSNEAQFFYAILRDLFQYTAYHAKTISDNVRDIDIAMRCGFGWQQGIFETWQNIGWEQVTQCINKDVSNKKTLVSGALPEWVARISAAYQENRAYAPAGSKWQDITMNPRQPYPLQIGSSKIKFPIIFENKSAEVYQYQKALVISFKTKLCTINDQVLDALNQALILAEQNAMGLIIWQKDSDNFSAGADLLTMATKFELGGVVSLELILKQFQDTMLRIRYAKVPVVTAVRGYVFGGGCELMMHSHKTVAALESYIGLVEVGVGLIPGAGGSKEMAYRASFSQNPEIILQKYFKQIAMADVAKGAYQAKAMGYLREDDVIIMNPFELLFVAYQQLSVMSEQPFVARRPELFKVQGKAAWANIMAAIANLRAGNFATEYDAIIAEKLANVMTGGNIEPNDVDEQWLLHLEREAFLSLAIDYRSQARIMHMMKTSKPLRN